MSTCGNICHRTAAIRLFRLSNKPNIRYPPTFSFAFGNGVNCICSCCCIFPLPLQRNRIISATLELLLFIFTVLVVLPSLHAVLCSQLSVLSFLFFASFDFLALLCFRLCGVLLVRVCVCARFYLVYAVVQSKHCTVLPPHRSLAFIACLHSVLCIFFV